MNGNLITAMETEKHSDSEQEFIAIEKTFWNTLSQLCSTTFVGKSTYPADPDDSFYNKTLVAQVQSCSANEIRVPFSVGENKSRTWIFTRSDSGIQLKHQHLHDDGSVDEVSNYGGIAIRGEDAISGSESNSRTRNITLHFPADEYTQKLIPAAATNVWSVSLIEKLDGSTTKMMYHLERHNKIRFNALLTKVQ